MKTLILLTAAGMPAEAVGLLPSLGGLTDTYYPGILRSQGQSDCPYPLLFSRCANAWGKSFYVCTGESVPAKDFGAGFPRDLQGVDCLILDLTAKHADYAEIDAKLRELLSNLSAGGEVCRLLLLCIPTAPVGLDEAPVCEGKAQQEIGEASDQVPEQAHEQTVEQNIEPISEQAAGHDPAQMAANAPDAINLPFLLYDGGATGSPEKLRDSVPEIPVELDTLCRLLFLGIESNDLDSACDEIEDIQTSAEKEPKKSIFANIFDWVEIFCVALVGVILLMTFVVRRSPVEGSSMYPTLIGHNDSGSNADPEHGVQSGYDDLLISNLFYTPKRQDIVIIQEPSQLSEPIVKRIIGLGGDRVKINFETWEVFVNGELLDEPYVNKKDDPLSSQLLQTDENNCWEGLVPKGCIFVLGDNRSISKDSRTFGYIDQRYIIGKVIFRIGPLSRFGTVDN